MFGLQQNVAKFLIYFVTIALTQLISESIGMLFAMLVASAELAMILLGIVFILLLALTGFLTSHTPVYYEWIGYLNYLRCESASNAAAGCNQCYCIDCASLLMACNCVATVCQVE